MTELSTHGIGRGSSRWLSELSNPSIDPPCTPFNPHAKPIERDACDSKKLCLELDDLVQQLGKMNFELDKWQAMAELAKSSNQEQRYDGTRNFRLMLSVSGEIPIQAVIDTGIVPTLVSYLALTEDVDLQFEAAWALTNIASGTSEQTEAVVQNGAIPEFVKLLLSPREDICEQGMWGLGNFAGDHAEFRDRILAIDGALEALTEAIERSSKVSTRRTGVWAISNLCRGHPRPSIHSVLGCVDLLIKFIKHYDTPDILSDACWALDGMVDHALGLQAIVDSDIVPRLVALLDSPFHVVQRPALRTIGQIATGNSMQTQVIIDAGVVSALLRLLKSPRRSVRKDACWTLSNITLGNEQQMQELLNCDAFPLLLDVFSTDEELEVKKEAAWAICSACIAGSSWQVSRLISNHCIRPVCEMLDINDCKVLAVVLDALARIMKIGESQGIAVGLSSNPYVQLFLEAEGLSRIIQLLQFPDYTINTKVYNIVSTYLSFLPEVNSWLGH
ncbi:putative importin alpha [Cardiosporidium cionae]|uniref:Importin subunit alpha n=1 Tax=Cardiosporidium cionae TaxID=476202 RepID=A0ABQ7JEI4_9APIC|nr:putative importin alpha [Cardiosporidium cionae]|eukprot:KAF8822427.1 putative importin alpha [Cardiosporidium cionae]